jgi:hypothetical protein
MLTAAHCLRRAERFRLKSFVTDNEDTATRLRDIAANYRRLADRAIIMTKSSSKAVKLTRPKRRPVGGRRPHCSENFPLLGKSQDAPS